MWQSVLRYDFTMRHKKCRLCSAVLIFFDKNLIFYCNLHKKLFTGPYSHFPYLHFPLLQIHTCIFHYLHFQRPPHQIHACHDGKVGGPHTLRAFGIATRQICKNIRVLPVTSWCLDETQKFARINRLANIWRRFWRVCERRRWLRRFIYRERMQRAMAASWCFCMKRLLDNHCRRRAVMMSLGHNSLPLATWWSAKAGRRPNVNPDASIHPAGRAVSPAKARPLRQFKRRYTVIHHASENRAKCCFCQNFVQFLLAVIILTKSGKKAEIMWGLLNFRFVQIASKRNTVLNTDVPHGYIMLSCCLQ